MRKKLDLSPEERRLYNNEMHRKQTKARKEKAEKEAYKEIASTVLNMFEKLGWDKTDMLVGADEDMIEKVAEELIKLDKFKIVFGSKVGIKIKERS